MGDGVFLQRQHPPHRSLCRGLSSRIFTGRLEESVAVAEDVVEDAIARAGKRGEVVQLLGQCGVAIFQASQCILPGRRFEHVCRFSNSHLPSAHHGNPISRSFACMLMHRAGSSRLTPSSLISASAASPKNECNISSSRVRQRHDVILQTEQLTWTSAGLRQLREAANDVLCFLEEEPAIRVDVNQVQLFQHLHRHHHQPPPPPAAAQNAVSMSFRVGEDKLTSKLAPIQKL